MKTKISPIRMIKRIGIACILLSFTTVLFVNCSKNNRNLADPQPYVLIVKFKDPSYKNHLIVTDYSRNTGGGSTLMRGNWCERTQWLTFGDIDADGSKIDGRSWDYDFQERFRDPFWALPDGWYLIDWAWHGLSTPYPYDGNTVLTEVTFENYTQYGMSEFPDSMPHIYKDRNDIFESRMIYVADLMGYSYPDGKYPSYSLREYNKKSGYDTLLIYSNQYFYHDMLMGIRPVSKFGNCLCEIADELDGYWAVLQSQITTVINNGDLDNIKKFDINQFNPKVE